MIWSILTATAYAFACLSLGLFLLQILEAKQPLHNRSALVKLATAFILGLGIISAIWLLLALVGWFKLSSIVPILILGACSGLRWLPANLSAAFAQIKTIWQATRSDSCAWQGIAAITLILLLAGLISMTPWEGDAIAVYLAVPKVLAASYRLTLLPGYETFMSVGLLGEMHAAAFIRLNNGSEPMALKLFSGLTSLAALIMLLGLSTQAGLQRRGKWLVAASYFTSSAIYTMLGNGKPDIIAAALGLAAYYYALTAGPGSLIGLFSGFAGVMKLSYLVTVFPGIAWLALWQELKTLNFQHLKPQELLPPLRKVLITGLKIAGWVILAFLPHFLKNWALLNAPFAPFGQAGIGWLDQNFFGFETTRRILLTYPFAITFGSYYGQAGDLSPLLLAFLPLAFCLPRPKNLLQSPLAALTLAASLGLLVWLLRFPSVLAPRYYLATLVIFFPIAMRGAEYLFSTETSPKMVTFFGVAMTIFILIAVGKNSLDYYHAEQVFDLPFTTKKYCENELLADLCVVEKKINSVTQPGDRVFLASYYRYWLRPDLLLCTNSAHEISLVYNGLQNPEPETGWRAIYQRGFKYLILDGSLPYLQADTLQTPAWVKATELIRSGQAAAYKLEFAPDAPAVKENIACQRFEKVWQIAPNPGQ